jgi:hypothetical protein
MAKGHCSACNRLILSDERPAPDGKGGLICEDCLSD